jgi:hypothetical protein
MERISRTARRSHDTPVIGRYCRFPGRWAFCAGEDRIRRSLPGVQLRFSEREDTRAYTVSVVTTFSIFLYEYKIGQPRQVSAGHRVPWKALGIPAPGRN